MITVMLADLRPEPNKVCVRPKEFGVGMLPLLASVGFGLFAFSTRANGPQLEDKTVFWYSMAGACLFISFVVFSKTFKKVEFIQFVSHHGRPLLDVADAGPERANFHSFVETLIGQIHATQAIKR